MPLLAHVSSYGFSFHQFPTTPRERHDKQLFRSPITISSGSIVSKGEHFYPSLSTTRYIYTVNIRFLLHRGCCRRLKNIIIIKIRTAKPCLGGVRPCSSSWEIIFGALLRILRTILSTTHPSILTGLSTYYIERICTFIESGIIQLNHLRDPRDSFDKSTLDWRIDKGVQQHKPQYYH